MVKLPICNGVAHWWKYWPCNHKSLGSNPGHKGLPSRVWDPPIYSSSYRSSKAWEVRYPSLCNCKKGILSKGRFLTTWLVMVSWDSTQVVCCYLPQVPGWGSVSLTHLFTHHSTENSQREKRSRWVFDNCGANFILITTGWDRPPVFLPRCSEATLAIWSERLAKGSYQKNTPRAVRLELTCNP